jgi:sterol desaturase/sphingolipid hydroxylase (fatty acid hydroxylase superfamily)
METSLQELILLISTPLYVCIILAEIFASHLHDKRFYSVRNTVTNLAMMLLNSALDILMLGVFFFVLHFFYQHRLLQIENVWLYWGMLLIAEDFVFYWLHYLEHHSRFFWAVHVTHHSSENFNLTVGFRSSVFQPLYRFVFFIPLAWLGFRASDIMVMYSATQIFGILAHTQFVGKLGLLETFFATPSNHRVHHASNVKYLDKNLGMVFMIWDKIFGTYQHEDEPVQYGLTKQPHFQYPADLLFHEWKDIWQDIRQDISWKDRLFYIFGPPGWSHNGTRQTSRQMQENDV